MQFFHNFSVFFSFFNFFQKFLTLILLLYITLDLHTFPGYPSFAAGENILFYYAGGVYSHKHTMWPLASALGDRGHNVTFLSPHTKQSWPHPNVTNLVPPKLEKLLSVFHDVDKIQQRLDGDARNVWNTFNEWAINSCDAILTDPTLNPLLYDTEIDLIFINAAFGECAYILAQKWRAKIILVDSTASFSFYPDIYSLPIETNWIPDVSSMFDYPMGFLDRVQNYFYSLMATWERHRRLYPKLEEMMQTFLKLDAPPNFLEFERSNTSLIFLNTHYSTDFSHALPPNFVQIGGIHLYHDRVQPIPERIQTFMDEAEDGVIPVIFGTSFDISKTHERFLQLFFNSFKSFPQIRFLLIWTEPLPPPGVPSNVLLSPWLPQKEILEHPKILAFLSHCGLYGISEATHQAVPIICIPLWADEDYDAYRIVKEGLGLKLEIRTLTSQLLTQAIQQILQDPKYKQNMGRMSALSKNRPMNPMDVALWWTEFVLHQDANLESLQMSQDLSWIQLRMLDIHSFLLLALLSVSWCVVKFSMWFMRKMSP